MYDDEGALQIAYLQLYCPFVVIQLQQTALKLARPHMGTAGCLQCAQYVCSPRPYAC